MGNSYLKNVLEIQQLRLKIKILDVKKLTFLNEVAGYINKQSNQQNDENYNVASVTHH
jgi:hypothetical protein